MNPEHRDKYKQRPPLPADQIALQDAMTTIFTNIGINPSSDSGIVIIDRWTTNFSEILENVLLVDQMGRSTQPAAENTFRSLGKTVEVTQWLEQELQQAVQTGDVQRVADLNRFGVVIGLTEETPQGVLRFLVPLAERLGAYQIPGPNYLPLFETSEQDAQQIQAQQAQAAAQAAAQAQASTASAASSGGNTRPRRPRAGTTPGATSGTGPATGPTTGPSNPNTGPATTANQGPKNPEWLEAQDVFSREWARREANFPQFSDLEEATKTRFHTLVDIWQEFIKDPALLYNQYIPNYSGDPTVNRRGKMRAGTEALIPKVWINNRVWNNFFTYYPSRQLANLLFIPDSTVRIKPTFTEDEYKVMVKMHLSLLAMSHPTDTAPNDKDPTLDKTYFEVWFKKFDELWKVHILPIKPKSNP